MSIDSIPRSSPEAETTLIPTLTDAELRRLYDEGIDRVGVVSLLLDPDMRMLLLEHRASHKTRAGAWGALGETALATQQAGSWQLESPIATTIRGLQEEVATAPQPNQLWIPRRVPVFFMEWPVGYNRAAMAYAVCPIVIMGQAMADAISQAPPTDEIASSTFVPIEQALEPRMLRPGMRQWLAHAMDAVERGDGSDLQVVEVPISPLEEPTQDAILATMYGTPDE